MEKKVNDSINELLKDHYLTPLQLAAAKRFVQTKVGNPEDRSVDRLREWIFMRVNGRKLPKEYHPRQLGCPDLMPGLPLKGWWDRTEFDWVLELEK